MMDETLKAWEDWQFVTFEKKALIALNLDIEQINFLNDIGLPCDAAPFLSFNASLETLNEYYYLNDSKFDLKIVIGSDCNGDPICIDLSDLKIYICDHEMEFENRFINSTPIRLFKFLTYYKDFIATLREQNGDEVYFDCNFSDVQLNDLTEKMRNTDLMAIGKETFWWREIETMKANRDFYINRS